MAVPAGSYRLKLSTSVGSCSASKIALEMGQPLRFQAAMADTDGPSGTPARCQEPCLGAGSKHALELSQTRGPTDHG